MTNRFPISISVEELYRPKYLPDPPKQPKGGWRLVKSAMIGLVLAVIICVVMESGAWFVPVFCGVTLVGWVCSVGKEGEE